MLLQWHTQLSRERALTFCSHYSFSPCNHPRWALTLFTRRDSPGSAHVRGHCGGSSSEYILCGVLMTKALAIGGGFGSRWWRKVRNQGSGVIIHTECFSEIWLSRGREQKDGRITEVCLFGGIGVCSVGDARILTSPPPTYLPQHFFIFLGPGKSRISGRQSILLLLILIAAPCAYGHWAPSSWPPAQLAYPGGSSCLPLVWVYTRTVLPGKTHSSCLRDEPILSLYGDINADTFLSFSNTPGQFAYNCFVSFIC